MENPLVVASSRRSFPGKIASSKLFTLTQGPGFTIGNNKVLPYSLSFGHCIACTICCYQFSAPQIAVPETPPANQSRIMVIHRYSIVVFLAKTRRLGDDPTFLPALPAFVTKPLSGWIYGPSTDENRFMIEHRLEVSSWWKSEKICATAETREWE